MYSKSIVFSVLYFLYLPNSVFAQEAHIIVRSDFDTYFAEYNVTGTYALYDAQENKYYLYNPDLFQKSFTPASTFKICNTLIALETGVFKDASDTLHWDKINRNVPSWNTDQNLDQAFRNSTVWFYQESARRTGANQMKYWLEKAEYGNRDTSGGIDKFWLSGGLRISPEQQIQFLRQLHENRLPFSTHSTETLKQIMIQEQSPEYILRAKTGWGMEGETDIGWYTGYIESGNKVWYFVNLIMTQDQHHSGFASARVEINRKILKELGIIQNQW